MTDLGSKQMQKIDAEIAKLIAETSKINRSFGAEISKIKSETLKLDKETFWYPMMITAGLFAGIGAIIKFIL